nr:hypothetical protein [uncultured bacterium]
MKKNKKKRVVLFSVLAALSAAVPAVFATPPALPGLQRTQTASFTPAASKLMRIWLINIGQGDSILIELPPSLSTAMGNPAGDPVEILVDGGGRPKSDSDRARIFLHKLRGERPTVEYMVLTHHDQDHIAGLTAVLLDPDIEVGRVYYNGLSAFRKGLTGFIPSNPGSGFVTGGKRVLGRFGSDGVLESPFVLADLPGLDQAFHGPPPERKPRLITEFEAFAGAAIAKPVQLFRRAQFGDDSPDSFDRRLTRNRTSTRPALKVQTLWPRAELLRYGGWGTTTNGNSVVFRLDYGDFSMLFTGDLNEQSGPGLVRHLADAGLEDRLDVDVLKAPHHGSEHIAEEFIEHPRLKPVVSVASMGSEGFRLTGHKHPRDSTIRLLGGFDRFFSTYIHEREFRWDRLRKSQLAGFIEDTHVLIETDGTRFRVVEVERDSPLDIDAVTEVDPGDGTLWISAK